MAAACSQIPASRCGCFTFLLDPKQPLGRRAVVAIVLYIVVLLIGGALFSWMEMANEIEAAEAYEFDVLRLKQQIVVSLANDTASREAVLKAVARLQSYAEAAGSAPSTSRSDLLL